MTNGSEWEQRGFSLSVPSGVLSSQGNVGVMSRED